MFGKICEVIIITTRPEAYKEKSWGPRRRRLHSIHIINGREIMKKSSARAWVTAVSVAVILFAVSGIVANTISLFMAQFSTVYS